MAATLQTQPDTYFELVRAFPLAPIRDHDHNKAALAMVDKLSRRQLDEGEETYLDVLVELIGRYESEAFPEEPVPTEDIVRSLVEGCNISQKELAKELGMSDATLSAIMSGSRKLNVKHIKAFSKRFGVPTSLFMED